ncbi:MAG: hypothetical protein IPK50_09505 [Fibrobacterota bacterium]|nr:hypothetical protein [Fibrobacterota bacterium]QQS07114.1 MAG: hypothetical protein IPK50_09505 [Fibrobacterota bacterium]
MDKLKIPKQSKIRDLVRDYICSKTGHPVDIASGKVTTEHIDFSFSGPILLILGVPKIIEELRTHKH